MRKHSLSALFGFVALAIIPLRVAAQQVIADSLVAARGEVTAFTVRLFLGEVPVGGAQLDVAWPTAVADLPAKSNGRANCTVNPDLARPQSIFAFQPPGCDPLTQGSCVAIRALIFDTSETGPIPDNTVLFTCPLIVHEDAAYGSYDIEVSAVVLSTPEGMKVPNALGTSGTLFINPPPTLTRTATVTEPPTITETPSVTETPTVTETPSLTPTPTHTATASASATPTSTHTTTPTHTATLTATVTQTVTATATASASPSATLVPLCVGDCNHDFEVTIDEVIVMINIALGAQGPEACPPGDANHDIEITIDEVIGAVNKALGACGI